MMRINRRKNDDVMERVEAKVDNLVSQMTVHLTEHAAIKVCMENYDTLLYGKDRKDGMVSDVLNIGTRQRVVIGVLTTVGIASLSGVGWLIINVINLSRELGH
jgi:hypothetical protein